jgi:hypothetical protein
MLRREFLGDALRGAAAAAVPAAGIAASRTADLLQQLTAQAEQTAREMGAALQRQGARISAANRRLEALEWRYRLVMALLMISLLIDGGMSWMLLTQTPAVIAI